MMRNLIVIIFLFFIVRIASAQIDVAEDSIKFAFPDSTFHLNEINIFGNEATKDFVIFREMTLKHDSLLTHETVEYDRNRIYSLGLFNKVEMEVELISGEKANLNVTLHERWFIYPYPIFGLRDRDWSKIYYGLGLAHINFRGRNEKVFGSFALGYDPWVALSYRNPFLEESGTHFLEGRFVYNKVRNKSVDLQQQYGDFDEQHFLFSTTVGKRFGIRHTVWVNLGYRIVEIPENVNSIIHSGTDKFLQGSIGYTYDTRDLHEYPAWGTYTAVSVTKFGVPSTTIDFTHINADYRRYIPLSSDVVLTTRAFGVMSAGGEKPVYEHVYFGYGERIRGHFREVMEGENLFGVSTELHYTLLEPKYIKAEFLPKEFSLWRFGITAAAFADAGIVWFREQRVVPTTLPSGYGTGLHFLLPYSFVLRTEVAWNEIGKSEFIFDLGASF
ncbi:MAG: BamA/TamA family outer membrane protein [Ignavibacteriae bacterium]|nr:BamA/TamA family outer membrane protein [Ignavibacteriota bacterium]